MYLYDKLKARGTHPPAWPVPHACSQPYHQGSGSHGQLFPLGDMWCVELAIRGVLCTGLGSKGLLKTALYVERSDVYAMLMSPNMG